MYRSSFRSSQRSTNGSDGRKCSVTSIASSYTSCVESFVDEFDRNVAINDQSLQRSAPTRNSRRVNVQDFIEEQDTECDNNNKTSRILGNGNLTRATDGLDHGTNQLYNRSTSAVTFADDKINHDKIDQIRSEAKRYDHQQSDPSGDNNSYQQKKGGGRRRSSIVQFIRRASSVSNTAYKNIKRALSNNSHHKDSSYTRRRSSIRIKHGVERPLIESVRSYVVNIIDDEMNDIEFEEEKCSYHDKDIEKIRQTDDMIIRFLLEYFEDHPKAAYLDRSCPIHGPRHDDNYQSPDGSIDKTTRFEEITEGKVMDANHNMSDGTRHECCGLEIDEKETKMYQTCIKNVGDQIIETLKWRKDFGVNELKNGDFPKELFTKDILVVGEDSDGSTVVYIRGSNYSKVTSSWTPIFVQFLVFESEKILEKCFGNPFAPKNPPGNKPGIVIDCSGIGYAQVDFSLTLSVLPILTKHYPQSFSYIWVYEIPWIAKPVLSLSMKMLPARHARKLRVIDKKAAICEMGIEGLPTFMGGKSDNHPKLDIPDDAGDIVSVGRKNGLSDCDISKMISLYGDKKFYKNVYGV